MTGDERREIELALGENTLVVNAGASLTHLVWQLADRCSETARVLRQAWKVGRTIKRRAYSEYLDEIEKTGICRAEFLGVGVFENGTLAFRAARRETLLRKTGTGEYIVISETDFTKTPV